MEGRARPHRQPGKLSGLGTHVCLAGLGSIPARAAMRYAERTGQPAARRILSDTPAGDTGQVRIT